MKRITLNVLEAHDAQYNCSLVREIEMTVDGITEFDGYSAQFWNDVRIYGLEEEAIRYLESKYGLTPEEGKELEVYLKRAK